jgi:hypothetical protein
LSQKLKKFLNKFYLILDPGTTPINAFSTKTTTGTVFQTHGDFVAASFLFLNFLQIKDGHLQQNT